MKKKFMLLFLLLCVCVGGCDFESTVSTPTYTLKTEKKKVNVTINVKYESSVGLRADSICDVYIDNDKMYSAQAANSTIKISTELKEGKHDIRIKTEDWGLVSGKRSNKIEFDVSQSNNKFSFTYKDPTLGDIKLWNNAETN